MTPLEKELIEATGVKLSKKNRQTGLQSMIRAVEKLPPDDYEALSDDAVDWYESGVAAMNDKQEVPDFDAEADEAADEDVAAEVEDDEAGGAADEAGAEEGAGDSAADTGTVEADEEAPAKAPAKKAKPTKKAAPQPKVPVKKTAKHPVPPMATGAKNRYGIYENTQLDAAIKMFEKGCSMAEIKKALGETKYNLIHRLIREGHRVEKVEGKFHLTHKDDVTKSKKKK